MPTKSRTRPTKTRARAIKPKGANKPAMRTKDQDPGSVWTYSRIRRPSRSPNSPRHLNHNQLVKRKHTDRRRCATRALSLLAPHQDDWGVTKVSLLIFTMRTFSPHWVKVVKTKGESLKRVSYFIVNLCLVLVCLWSYQVKVINKYGHCWHLSKNISDLNYF